MDLNSGNLWLVVECYTTSPGSSFGSRSPKQTWYLSKNLHRRIFRLKILHRQFHLISTVLVRKNTKNEWKWRNLHRWQKFYTAAGTDGMDKFHLCRHPTLFVHTIAGLNTVRSRQQAPCRQMGISSMYCINNIRPKTKDKLRHCKTKRETFNCM